MLTTGHFKSDQSTYTYGGTLSRRVFLVFGWYSLDFTEKSRQGQSRLRFNIIRGNASRYAEEKVTKDKQKKTEGFNEETKTGVDFYEEYEEQATAITLKTWKIHSIWKLSSHLNKIFTAIKNTMPIFTPMFPFYSNFIPLAIHVINCTWTFTSMAREY